MTHETDTWTHDTDRQMDDMCAHSLSLSLLLPASRLDRSDPYSWSSVTCVPFPSSSLFLSLLSKDSPLSDSTCAHSLVTYTAASVSVPIFHSFPKAGISTAFVLFFSRRIHTELHLSSPSDRFGDPLLIGLSFLPFYHLCYLYTSPPPLHQSSR